MRIIDKISAKKLKELYWHREMSSSEIAKIYHCDPGYIRDLLKKYKIRTRTISEARKLVFKINIPKKELKKLYIEKRLSSPEIARIYKCNHTTICNRLREYGITVRTQLEARRLRSKINIPKRELKKLYLEQKKSSPAIAEIYLCSPEYVRHLLRKYEIKIRTKSEARQLFFNINIPRKELQKLYSERKMSSFEIAKKFNCSSATVREKLREYHISIRSHYEAHLLCNKPKYPQYNFSGDLEEKAYLIGFSKGDLHVKTRSANSPTIFVNVGSTKPKLIKIVEESFSPYGHIWKSKPRKDGVVYIWCSLNRTFDFLLAKEDLIEPWILKNKNYFAAFLAGYADAEGSFCICGDNGVVYVGSQDKNIIHQIRKKLIELGILCRPPQIKRKKGIRDVRGTISNEDIWGLWVYRKDALLKLVKLINPYSKHTDKRLGMEIVKNNVLERNKRYNNQQDRKYYKLYLEEGIKI